jgi:putative ABC transport system ATP-binding protein
MLGIGLGKNGTNGTRDNEYLIELSKVEKQYQTAAGPFLALKGVDLRVDTGEFVAVVGKSGSGKSTLINMITITGPPGEVVAETAIHTMAKTGWRRGGAQRRVIFQFFQLLPSLTVMERDAAHGLLHMYSPRSDRAMELLKQAEIPEQAHNCHRPFRGQQHGGPSANDSDPSLTSHRHRIPRPLIRSSAVRAACGPGKTILMVTHDQDLPTGSPDGDSGDGE